MGDDLSKLDFDTRQAFTEKYKESTQHVKNVKWKKTIFILTIFGLLVLFIAWFWRKLDVHDKKMKD